ncbi:aspartate carbamoyltransferase catalytic subunit [Thermostichus vulcanus]|uniref:Aspartate carbamoyltransferase n=1 Tax=Thermostichus vulcanus str. 'Rupite' TaxID=2813851 RepID=A0ABT0C9Z4_THEVL|nr:aspartate carbamoyltransferase catalytic subunit [Thermostichus vulcanus]MCJ2542604.1 aspartate carbamoyltransferase catalytic subunit [Thermostichus vulcanus str. 'Rupite']
MVWQRQHVLGLADFTPEEYQIVLQTSASFREVLTRRLPKVPTLQGKVVATLFFEASTRTRNSFELAAKRLSADVLNFAPGTSSLSKGETILDTARTFLAMGSDLLIIRHAQAGVPQQLAAEITRRGSPTGVLNAGDGLHEHPTQGLLDLFTLCAQLTPERPHLEALQGVKIAIVGDILHSRVARSDIYALVAAGAEVHLAGPPTLLPKEFAQLIPGHTLPIHWQLDSALEGSRFVITLRLQQERMSEYLLPSLREYHHFFGITQQRLRLCHPQVKLLHPGPVNRGVELSSEVMEDPDLNLIEQQVTHGVAVRMALLYLMGGGRIPT